MTTIRALLPQYEAYLRHELQRAEATVISYLSDLRGLSNALDKPVEQISRNDLRGYMRGLGARGISRATVRRKIGGMSTFWKWMIDEGYVANNATSGIVLPKVERKIALWLTESEVQHFVQTPDATPRNALAWGLLAWLGLRRNELRRLRCADVNFSEGVIIVRNTKGKKDRTLPIPAPLVAALRAQTAHRAKGAYLLPGDLGGYWSTRNFYRCFRAHAVAAGLPDITPHTLRHTLATHMSQRGVPLRVIQQWLGHERLETTSVYLHVAPEFMQQALDKHVLNAQQTTG